MADIRISNLTQGTPLTADFGVYTDGATTKKFALLNTPIDFEINYLIGNAGTTAISQTGMYPYFRVNRAGSISAIEVMSGTILGNATVSIWKGSYGTPPVGTAQTIMGAVGTEVITFTGGSKAIGTPTVTAFGSGAVFAPYLNGAGTIPFLSIMMHCKGL